MKKNLLILCILFSTSICIQSAEEQSLVVKSKTGSESVHTLNGVQRIVFSGTTISVVKKNTTQSDYTLGNVQKLLFALRSSTTTNIIKIHENDLKVYPNPSTDILFVEGINFVENIHLYNLFGNEFSVPFVVVGNILQAKTSRLPQGLYLLQINNKIIKFKKQ